MPAAVAARPRAPCTWRSSSTPPRWPATPRCCSEARAHLERILGGQDAFLARFAAAADQFQEPGNWFTRLTGRRNEQPLDLKKLGTFPIVHGVRALALQYGVREQGTAARLARLVQLERIEPDLARTCCRRCTC